MLITLQESKLYYDPDLACYLQYDYDKKEYSVHSRLKLPPSEDKEKRNKHEDVEISSDEEFLGKGFSQVKLDTNSIT